jgi:hypothetical protein
MLTLLTPALLCFVFTYCICTVQDLARDYKTQIGIILSGNSRNSGGWYYKESPAYLYEIYKSEMSAPF